MSQTIVSTAAQAEKIAADWGGLTWYASRKLGNTTELTLGLCTIRPGKSNPLHRHPNCSEVLVVLDGTIMHTIEGGEVRMEAGDTITVAAGFNHQARNIGTADAHLIVCFPTADRKVENE